MSTSRRNSYVIMAVLLVLIGWFHLGTLALTSFFGYFALEKFSFGRRRKAVGVIIYLIAIAAIFYGLIFFSRRAVKILPEIAKQTIPAVVDFAQKKGIELPFSDYDELKTVALKEVQDKFANIGRYAREAT